MIEFIAMPKDRKDLDGKEDFSLVEIVDDRPTCKVHGAMNKVSKDIWRCLTLYGRTKEGKFIDRACNACCLEGGKKCNNCGEFERNHYLGTEDREGGVWCHQISQVNPKDKDYFMSYDDGSQTTGSRNGGEE